MAPAGSSDMHRIDPHAIATRVRGLLAGQDGGDWEVSAGRLGVNEVALRMTIDELSPVPALEVLAAIIGEYGVDPSWLIHGEYDAGTHRAALAASDPGPSLLDVMGQRGLRLEA